MALRGVCGTGEEAKEAKRRCLLCLVMKVGEEVSEGAQVSVEKVVG